MKRKNVSYQDVAWCRHLRYESLSAGETQNDTQLRITNYLIGKGYSQISSIVVANEIMLEVLDD